MMVAYKDKNGNLHVGPVSEMEGARINREVSSMGYATAPGPEEERNVNQESSERTQQGENPELAGPSDGVKQVEAIPDADKKEIKLEASDPSQEYAPDYSLLHDILDVVEIDANFYDDMELDTFLFHDINLSREKFGEVETRLLRQVSRAFYGIRFDRKLDQVILAEPGRDDTEPEYESFGTEINWSSELNFPEHETGKIDPNDRGNLSILVPPDDHEADKEKTESASKSSPIKIDRETLLNDVPYHEYVELKWTESFSRSIFKDILYNCVKGKGSFIELLLIALFLDTSREKREYFRLFHEGSISFQTFKNEVSDETIFSLYRHVRGPLIESKYDIEWNWWSSKNVMVEKIFHEINQDWLDFAPILINLPEKDWKASILTDDFFELTNK